MKTVSISIVTFLIVLSTSLCFAQDATATPTAPKNEVEFNASEAKCLVSFTEFSTPLGGPSADMIADIDVSGIAFMTGKLVEVVTRADIAYVHVYVALTDHMYYDIWFLGTQIKYNQNCEYSAGRALDVVTADSFPCLAVVSPYTVSAYKFSGSDALGNTETASFIGQKVLILGAKDFQYEIKLTKKKGDQVEKLIVEPTVYLVAEASLVPDDSCYKTNTK